MAEFQRGLRIAVDEGLLHRRLVRTVRRDHSREALVQDAQPLGQVLSRLGMDCARGDIDEPGAVRFDDAQPVWRRPGSIPRIRTAISSLVPRVSSAKARRRRGCAGPFYSLVLKSFSLENTEFDVDVVLVLDRRLLRAGPENFLVRARLMVIGLRRLFGRNERRAVILDDGGAILGRALHFEIKVDLRAEAERHRIHRRQRGGIPVGAVADCGDGRLGGAGEAHDLRVLELRMVAHQPEDGVGPVWRRDKGV